MAASPAPAVGGGPDAADLALLARFESGALPREEFSHAAHVRAAWTLLADAPLTAAIARYAAALARLTARYGVPELYSETLTVFYLVVIHARRQAAPAAGFDAFRAANPDLFEPVRSFAGRCYPPGLLDDPASKREFRLPLRWPA